MDERNLSRAARRKMKQVAKKTAKKRAMKRKMRAKRKKNTGQLKSAANKAAKNAIVKKLTGKKMSQMSISEKERIEKKLSTKKGLIQKVARKMLPKIKKKERERIKSMRAKAKNKVAERSSYRGDPYWMKAKYDGVSGEQRLPVQRRMRAGGEKFKKGDEVLFWPKGKVIMVGKKADQAWREFQSQVSDEDAYMSQYEGTQMEKLEERYDDKEYKKAIKFLSGLHSSILKAKDKALRWLNRKGFGKVAGDVDDMSSAEWQSFLSDKVYEEKLREHIRKMLKEISNR